MAAQPERDSSDLILDVALDRAAIEAVVRKFGPTLLGYLIRKLGDRNWAEEVFQEVFLKVCEQAEDYDEGRGPLEAWIMAITKYEVLTALKTRTRRTRKGPVLAIEEGSVKAPLPTEQDFELRERMVALVHDTLTAAQEKTVFLAWLASDGQPDYVEIARVHRWSVRALSGALVRAKRKMRPVLRAAGLDPSAMGGD